MLAEFPLTETAARRVAAAFRANGLSATMAIAPCTSGNLEENVKVAAEIVQQAKRQGDRGSIHRAELKISFESARIN